MWLLKSYEELYKDITTYCSKYSINFLQDLRFTNPSRFRFDINHINKLANYINKINGKNINNNDKLNNIKKLFINHILSCYLTKIDKSSNNQYKETIINIATNLLCKNDNTTIEDIKTILNDSYIKWISVPILVICNNNNTESGKITYFLVGGKKEKVSKEEEKTKIFIINEELLHKQTINCIKNIHLLNDSFTNSSYIKYFIIPITYNLTGCSLTLPITAAFYILDKGINKQNEQICWTDDIYMSGKINENGDIEDVEHINKKIRSISTEQIDKETIFLIPLDSYKEVDKSYKKSLNKKIKLFPVKKWLEVTTLIDAPEQEREEIYKQLDLLNESCSIILKSIDSINVNILKKYISLLKGCKDFIDFGNILHIDNLNRFLLLINALESNQHIEEKASLLRQLTTLQDICNIDDIITQETNDRDSIKHLSNYLFRWASLHIAMYHYNIDNIDKNIYNKCKKICEKLLSKDYIEPKLKIQYLNRTINSNIVRFNFNCLEQTEKLENLLIENNYRNFNIATAYATLAQLYGYLNKHQKLEECIKKAQQLMPFDEKLYERLRLYSYYIYSYLDKAEYKNALKNIYRYMNITIQDSDITDIDFRNRLSSKEKIEALLKKFESKNRPYILYAIVRYIADVLNADNILNDKFIYKTTYDALKNIVEENKKLSHPWQLIIYNLARIAKSYNQKDDVNILLKYFIEICSKTSHNTIKIMGLLGLSSFNDRITNNSTIENRNKIINDIINLLSSDYFNKEHFKELIDKGVGNILEEVARNTKKYFPFMYR